MQGAGKARQKVPQGLENQGAPANARDRAPETSLPDEDRPRGGEQRTEPHQARKDGVSTPKVSTLVR